MILMSNAMMGAAGYQAVASGGGNVVLNGDFSDGVNHWVNPGGYLVSVNLDGQLYIDRNSRSITAALRQFGILEPGKQYSLTVDVIFSSYNTSFYFGAINVESEIAFSSEGIQKTGTIIAAGSDLFISPSGHVTAESVIDNIVIIEVI